MKDEVEAKAQIVLVNKLVVFHRIFLASLGAKFEGLGTHRVVVQGTGVLSPTAQPFVVPSDRIEAATFAFGAIATGGEVELQNVCIEDIRPTIGMLTAMGAAIEITDASSVRICVRERLTPVRAVALPHPGFPTDALPLLVVSLALVEGISTVKDEVFPDRYAYIPELRKMGARLSKKDTSLQIAGVSELRGCSIGGTDLRATAALAVAGLAASGETILTNAEYIARGYSNFPEKLRSLGADIEVI